MSRPYQTDASHDEAMDIICGAGGVTVLSYEEVIACYLRLRGIMRDGAKMAADPRFEALDSVITILRARDD